MFIAAIAVFIVLAVTGGIWGLSTLIDHHNRHGDDGDYRMY